MEKLLIAVVLGIILFLVVTHQARGEETPPPPLTPQERIISAFPDAPIMYHVAEAESSFIPTAKNASSTASGLFQITLGTWQDAECTGNVFNAEDNIACARTIYDLYGLSPWNASKSKWGRYLKTIPEGT